MSFPVPSRLVGAVHWPWRGLCHDHRDQPDGVGQVGGARGMFLALPFTDPPVKGGSRKAERQEKVPLGRGESVMSGP